MANPSPPSDAENDRIPSQYRALHARASRHRAEIERNEACGCFHCLSIFPGREVVEWVDKDEHGVGQTALCPRCGIDSVIASLPQAPLNRAVLRQMQRHYFGALVWSGANWRNIIAQPVMVIYLLSCLASTIAWIISAGSPGAWLAMPALLLAGWAFLGHLITLDDDSPGGWSNPQGSRIIWRHSLIELSLKGLAGLIALSLFIGQK